MPPVSRPRLATAAVVAFVFAVVVGGCGSSGKSKSASSSSTSSSSTTSSTGAVPSSTSAASANPLASAPPPGSHFDTTVSFVRLPAGGGLVLVGPNGHSLYAFDRDHGTTSACTDGCASTWPGLTSSGTPTVAAGLDASKAGTAAAGQVTYNGHLLYYYAGDNAPGDTNGLSISGWHVVSPLGTAMAGR